MRKSLFTKLISAYFVVIFISYSLVAVFLSYWFYRNYYNQKTDMLIKQGYKLNKTINDYLNRRITRDKLITQINTIDEVTGSTIWIIDKYGFLYAYSSNDMKELLGKQITDSQIQRVLSGEIVVISGGFRRIFQNQC